MIFRFLTVTLFVVFMGVVVPAQSRFSGIVVGVIDGKTVVIDTSSGKINAQLQYIEVPDPEQPLHSAIREHISKLTVGKSVEFSLLRILPNRTVGRLTLGGVDVSQQMLRDGAAWHEPSATSGQASPEAAEYDRTQTSAKEEKRGVWAIPNLLPPSQVQAARLAAEAAVQSSKPAMTGVSQYQTDTRSGARASGPGGADRGAWADVFGGVGTESAGLITRKSPKGDFEVVYTSVMFVNLTSGARKQKVECRTGYTINTFPDGQKLTMYQLGFRAISEGDNFSKQRSALSVAIDNQVVSLGSPRGFKGDAYYGTHELFFYRVSMATLKRMASSKNVELRINGFKGEFSEEAKQLLRQLLDATS